jgi:hypothetical protein
VHSFCSFPMFVLWFALDLISAVVIPYLLSGFFLIIIFLTGKKSDCVFLWFLQRQKIPGHSNMKLNFSKITKQKALTMKEYFITVSIIFRSLLQYFIQRCWYYLPVDFYRQSISTVQFSRFICKSLSSCVWHVDSPILYS